jgi:hypothetical protein
VTIKCQGTSQQLGTFTVAKGRNGTNATVDKDSINAVLSQYNLSLDTLQSMSTCGYTCRPTGEFSGSENN